MQSRKLNNVTDNLFTEVLSWGPLNKFTLLNYRTDSQIAGDEYKYNNIAALTY